MGRRREEGWKDSREGPTPSVPALENYDCYLPGCMVILFAPTGAAAPLVQPDVCPVAADESCERSIPQRLSHPSSTSP